MPKHSYPGPDGITSDCIYGCGAWTGPVTSGGPDGIDPLGECPFAPPDDRPVDFESDPIAAALANGEEHGYARGARDERARIRRELLETLKTGWGPMAAPILTVQEIRAALDRIAPAGAGEKG